MHVFILVSRTTKSHSISISTILSHLWSTHKFSNDIILLKWVGKNKNAAESNEKFGFRYYFNQNGRLLFIKGQHKIKTWLIDVEFFIISGIGSFNLHQHTTTIATRFFLYVKYCVYFFFLLIWNTSSRESSLPSFKQFDSQNIFLQRRTHMRKCRRRK